MVVRPALLCIALLLTAVLTTLALIRRSAKVAPPKRCATLNRIATVEYPWLDVPPSYIA